MTIVEKQPSDDIRERIRAEFLRTGDSARALAERTALVDGVVRDAWREHLVAAGNDNVVLAVGGYGRRHLFPYSDVDLLLLVENEKQANGSKEAISNFLRQLWDEGLRVSHSVRTPAECAELHERNLELNVSLLDQRFLVGDGRLYADLMERLPRFIHGQRESLIRKLSRMARERHEKHQRTFYHLEPNIKEAPGGLRDFQLMCWLDQVRNSTSRRVAMTDPPVALLDSWRFLSSLRCLLHYRAGRDNNVFSFDEQEAVAEHWNRADAAEWMRDYFRHARTIFRIAIRLLEESEAQASSLFSQFRDWRSRLSNADFTVSRERVHFRVPQQLDVDPELALRLFQFVARHGIRLSLQAEERIAVRLPHLAVHFSSSHPVWPHLREILSLPFAHMALRAMHDTGVLRLIFPELERIECLVIRDFYHRYTVDEHTLVTVQVLDELRGSGDPARKRYAEILSELENPALLKFALLFHDVGKADRSGNHVSGSEQVAEVAMDRMQMPSADREMVLFLIRSHLELSATMVSRDLYDRATAQQTAHGMGTVERLKALTLMTFADISAVNPTAMTPWRSEQLWQLYLQTYNELTRELETERIEKPKIPPEKASFLEGFPTRYLRTHSDEEIEAHQRLEEQSRKRGVAVDLEKTGSVYRLTLVAPDRPFLFASVAGNLSGFGMNILKAEAFANRSGIVLDTFTFTDPSRTLDLNPTEHDRLRTMVERVSLGKVDVKQLLKNRPKPAPPSRRARVQAAVSFDSEASLTATLIEIVAQDRPGLLYDLASAVSSHGCNIEVVLVDTEAHKAIDVFYVTFGGAKLGSEIQQALAQTLQAVVTPRPS